jgi:hypothetical protein
MLLCCCLAIACRSSEAQQQQQEQQPLPRRERDLFDFSKAYDDPGTGLKCVNEEASVQTIEKEKLLECVHSTVNVCHYTYVTRFSSQRQEECLDNYGKVCTIAFNKQAVNETMRKCYTPMVKECNGDKETDGKEICQTVYESDCSTRYVEKQPGRFVGDTKCTKVKALRYSTSVNIQAKITMQVKIKTIT